MAMTPHDNHTLVLVFLLQSFSVGLQMQEQDLCIQ